LLRGEASAAALFYVFGKLPHGFLGDDAAFATGQGGLGFIDGGEHFGASTLASLPEGKGFFHHVFLPVEPSAPDRLAGKAFWFGVNCTSSIAFRVGRTRRSVKLWEIPDFKGLKA
jgi:hypothetical protein